MRWTSMTLHFGLLFLTGVAILYTTKAHEHLWEMTNMEAACHEEIQFVEKLQDSLHRLSKDTREFFEYQFLKDFEETSGRLLTKEVATIEEKVRSLSGNPIIVLQMISRHEKFDDLLEKVQDVPELVVCLAYLEKHLRTAMNEAVSAMVELVEGSNIDPVELADGNILGVKTGARLRSEDLESLGHVARFKHYRQIAVKFYQLALNRESDVAKQNELRTLLNTAYKKANMTRTNLIKHSRRGNAKERQMKKTIYQVHRSICQGRAEMDQNVLKTLRCWYEHQVHPYWAVNPLKVELLWTNPAFIQVHNFIGAGAIADLKSLIAKIMHGERRDGKKQQHPLLRFQLRSGAPDSDYAEFQHLSKKIGFMTGFEGPFTHFSLDDTGHMQRVEHDIMSFLRTESLFNVTYEDFPMAFINIFLESPIRGGQMCYMAGKILAQPIEGSALFWYTLDKKAGLLPCRHIAHCPNALGRKWHIAKEFFYSEQYTEVCGLDPQELFSRFQLPTTKKRKRSKK